MLEMMAAVKWDSSEISTDASPYISEISKEARQLRERMNAVQSLVVPGSVKQSIWEGICFVTMIILVEGFSRARKVCALTDCTDCC